MPWGLAVEEKDESSNLVQERQVGVYLAKSRVVSVVGNLRGNIVDRGIPPRPLYRILADGRR